jgi:hypothetical protein
LFFFSFLCLFLPSLCRHASPIPWLHCPGLPPRSVCSVLGVVGGLRRRSNDCEDEGWIALWSCD